MYNYVQLCTTVYSAYLSPAVYTYSRMLGILLET